MDTSRVRYGFFSTYNHTWVLERIDQYHFRACSYISAAKTGTPESFSLREAFLFLAAMASSSDDAFVEFHYDQKLVSMKIFEKHLTIETYVSLLLL